MTGPDDRQEGEASRLPLLFHSNHHLFSLCLKLLLSADELQTTSFIVYSTPKKKKFFFSFSSYFVENKYKGNAEGLKKKEEFAPPKKGQFYIGSDDDLFFFLLPLRKSEERLNYANERRTFGLRYTEKFVYFSFYFFVNTEFQGWAFSENCWMWKCLRLLLSKEVRKQIFLKGKTLY